MRSRSPIVIQVARYFGLAFESFFFKRIIPIGGVVMAQAPEIQHRGNRSGRSARPVPIDLLLVNEFMPEERR